MKPEEEVLELQATIEAITGRKVVSTNLVHLRKRLAALRPPPSQTPTWEANAEARRLVDAVDLVLGDPRRAEIARALARVANTTPAHVVQRAVDEYAVRQGLGPHVEALKKGHR